VIKGPFTPDPVPCGAARRRTAPQCNAMHMATHHGSVKGSYGLAVRVQLVIGMHIAVITSAEEGGYVFSAVCLSVCLSVCLFACLSVGLLANL